MKQRINRTSLEDQLLQLRTEFGEYGPDQETRLEYSPYYGYRLYKIGVNSSIHPITDYMTGREMHYYLEGWHDGLSHCLKEVLKHRPIITD